MAKFVSTTRWKDTEIKNIQEAFDKFLIHDDEFFNTEGSKIVYSDFRREKIFEDDKIINLRDVSYLYNIFHFRANTKEVDDTNPFSPVQEVNYFIVVYQQEGVDNNVNYIIDSNSDSLTVLRKLLRYKKKGVVVENKIFLDNDIFLWIIKKVFSEENSLGSIDIHSVIGVRGETGDENTLLAQGNTVLNLVSTLAFILETNLLKQLVLRVGNNEHEILELRLNDKGVVAISEQSYSGAFDNYGNGTAEKKASIFLLSYLSLLPIIRQAYLMQEDEWLNEQKTEFFEKVQEDLMARLATRKKEIS
ncbi:hypothetical protein [Lactococcus lactis]|uniref:hypothetical protein n=1 Tax=Lactococcus lactis TaxID=1358 RepID=UPI001F5A916E|nr:hypothetical protein [Lactococcus lactis]